MADVNQINRNLLLCSLNPNKPDLITMVGEVKGDEALTDERLKEIHDELVFSSYDAIERHMDPKCYGFFNAEDGSMVFTLKKPEHIPEKFINEYPLGRKSPITGVLFSMIDAKQSTGVRNVEFDYSSILSQLAPEKMQDQLRQSRKELHDRYKKHEELPAGHPQKEELKHEMNGLIGQARTFYSNPLQMLSLAAQDSKERLILGAGSEEDMKNKKITVGVLDFDEQGSIKVLAAPTVDETALALTDGETSKALAQIIESDYEIETGEDSNDYIKALVTRTFSPLSVQMTEVNYEKEVANHNSYISAYTAAMENFLKTSKNLIENLLGIYMFFQQYENTVKSRGGMRPSILVANCNPELLARSAFIGRLQLYLSSVNNINNYDNTIWHAILPNVSMSKADDIEVEREAFATTKERKNTTVQSLETLSILCSTLADYSVRTFFSFETGEETNFDRVSKEGIEPFRDRVETLEDQAYSAYLIPCLPNPTVISKNKSAVVTGKLLQVDDDVVSESEEREDVQRFYLHGVYIPAAYVAAGIVSAWACPEFMREKFKRNVDPTLPGVRFDIESGNNALVVPATAALEIAGYTQTVKQQINRNAYGFVFASETQRHNNRAVNNLTVYKARSLASDGVYYEPIYQSIVTDYFERVLRQATGDNKLDNIRHFFSANPNSQMSIWKTKEGFVNAVIQPGDEITYSIDEESSSIDIDFSFGGVQKNLNVQLNKSSH